LRMRAGETRDIAHIELRLRASFHDCGVFSHGAKIPYAVRPDYRRLSPGQQCTVRLTQLFCDSISICSMRPF
jgi:hypothetical protein